MLLAALGLYTLWKRIAPAASNSSSTGSGGGSGRSRIKGIKDLPHDPKGG